MAFTTMGFGTEQTIKSGFPFPCPKKETLETSHEQLPSAQSKKTAEWEDMIKDVHINEPAINRRVRDIRCKAGMLQGGARLAWLIKAIELIDLTSLGSDDTDRMVEDLCHKAANPVKLPFAWPCRITTAAVCIYPKKVKVAESCVKRENVPIAVVSTGFPAGLGASPFAEFQTVAKMKGVNEVDIVIDRSLVLMHRWNDLYNYLQAIRESCPVNIAWKTILGTGEFFDLKDVYKASIVAMTAGTTFIKTSTGKEAVNATLPVGVVMCRAIKAYRANCCKQVGLKPAGGIKTAQEALEWMMLVKLELGDEWLNKKYFRIGASSLLDNIVAEIHSLCQLN